MFNWRELPFVRLLLPLMMGIALGYWQWINITPYFSGTLLLIVTVVLSTQAFKRQHYQQRWFFGALLFLWMLFLGHLNTILFKDTSSPKHFSRLNHSKDTAIGKIVSLTEKKHTYKMVLQMKGLGSDLDSLFFAEGNLLLHLEKGKLESIFRVGDYLVFKAKIREIPPPKNPKQFNAANYYATQNIHYQAFASNNAVKHFPQEDYSLFSILESIRSYGLKLLREHLKSEDTYYIGAALLLGAKSALPTELKTLYSEVGAIHVLAVSGLHVGFIYLLLSYGLKIIRLRGQKWKSLHSILSIAGIWFYSLLTGGSPSVLRAATLFSFMLIGKAFQRATNIYNTLAASACLLLIINPFLLANIGFQLSYLALLGLISYQAYIYKLLPFLPNTFDYIWKLISISIAAQLSTLPLSLFYFHQFPVYFWLSGIVVVPGAMLILITGVLTLITGHLIPFMGMAMGYLIKGMNWIMIYINSLPFHLIKDIWIDSYQLITIYFLLFFITLFCWSSKKTFLLVALLILLGISIYYPIKTWQRYQKEELVFYFSPKGLLFDAVSRGQVFSIQDKAVNADYLAQPYRSYLGLEKKALITPSSPQFFQIGKQKIGFINSPLHTNCPIALDYLILYNNPKIHLDKLLESFSPKMIILDASNTYYKNKELEKSCKTKGIPCVNLWHTGAYNIDLNNPFNKILPNEAIN